MVWNRGLLLLPAEDMSSTRLAGGRGVRRCGL
jgi:hypothetical protein